MIGVSMPTCTDGQDLAMQGSQSMLHLGSHHGLAKQADQVIRQHGKTQSGFSGPEIIARKAVQPEIGRMRLRSARPPQALSSRFKNLTLIPPRHPPTFVFQSITGRNQSVSLMNIIRANPFTKHKRQHIGHLGIASE